MMDSQSIGVQLVSIGFHGFSTGFHQFHTDFYEFPTGFHELLTDFFWLLSVSHFSTYAQFRFFFFHLFCTFLHTSPILPQVVPLIIPNSGHPIVKLSVCGMCPHIQDNLWQSNHQIHVDLHSNQMI